MQKSSCIAVDYRPNCKITMNFSQERSLDVSVAFTYSGKSIEVASLRLTDRTTCASADEGRVLV